jgi:site-specific DNA recombinase
MKTATYLRQSLDRDLTKVSIDYQREGLLKLCADKRWDDPVEVTRRNVSATTGRRDAYEDLCEDIRNGIIGRVACSTLMRWKPMSR